jgi:acyl dehydratase
MSELLVGPIDQDWVAAYAQASGDDNPLHIRKDGPTIVHGALLAALAERFILQALPGIRILSLRLRFITPVRVGNKVSFRLGAQRQSQGEERPIVEQKIMVSVPGQRPAVLIECRFEAANP